MSSGFSDTAESGMHEKMHGESRSSHGACPRSRRALTFLVRVSVAAVGLVLRLPSDLNKPRGSFTHGMPALDRACHIISFKLWWRITLPELRLQERQWIAVALTKTPPGARVRFTQLGA